MLIIFNTGSALSGAMMLAMVSRDADGTHGYRIARDARCAVGISESTLYLVLRQLQKEDYLEVYDMAIDGRNCRYYKVTEKDRVQLSLYRGEWTTYSQKISQTFKEAGL